MRKVLLPSFWVFLSFSLLRTSYSLLPNAYFKYFRLFLRFELYLLSYRSLSPEPSSLSLPRSLFRQPIYSRHSVVFFWPHTHFSDMTIECDSLCAKNVHHVLPVISSPRRCSTFAISLSTSPLFPLTWYSVIPSPSLFLSLPPCLSFVSRLLQAFYRAPLIHAHNESVHVRSRVRAHTPQFHHSRRAWNWQTRSCSMATSIMHGTPPLLSFSRSFSYTRNPV